MYEAEIVETNNDYFPQPRKRKLKQLLVES